MLVYYGIPASVVFVVALSAFWLDAATPKNRPSDWAFIGLVALLWPVTAPFIVWKKVSKHFNQQSKAPRSLSKADTAHRPTALEAILRR